MSSIVHTIRLVASASAAIAEVQKYGEAIVGTAQTVDRHANVLSGDKLLKSANEWTAAVAKMGGASHDLASSEQILAGASKLTATEKERLNRTLEQAIEKYRALGHDAPPAMLALAEATRQADEPTGSLADRVTAVVAASAAADAAIRQVAAQVTDWTDASSEQEDALVRMNTALRAQGTYTPELSQQYADLAGQYQRTTKYGDELIESMVALLVQIGDVAPKDMQAALTASTDLAAGLRIDLNSATMLVAKALEGNTGALSRYGIQIDDAALRTKGAQAVFEAIADKMGGQATAQAQTFSGQMAVVGNVVGDVKEILGQLLAEGVTPLTRGFMSLPEPVRTTITVIGLLAGVAGTGGAAVAAIVAAGKLALPLFGVQVPAALGTAATAGGALASTLLSVVLPALAVVATALAAWEIGRWIAGLTGADDAVERLAGGLMGLSAAEIEASHAAREHAAMMIELAPLIDQANKGLEKQRATIEARAAHALAMDWNEAERIGKELTQSAEKMAAALEEINSAGRGWKGTLETINGAVIEAVKYYLDAGVAQNTLATAYELTATQVKAVASALAEEKAALEVSKQSAIETTKLWEQFFALRIQHGGTATDAQIAQVDAWFNAEVAKLKESDANWVDHYNALVSVAGEMTQSVLVDWKAIADHSRAALQQTADKAQATFRYMLDHADQFSAETIAQFWRTAEEAQRAADNWGLSFGGALDAVAAKSATTAGEVVRTWADAMGQVSRGLGTLSFTLQNPYALSGNMSPEEMAARARELGGRVARDDYNNPYVYVADKNAPGRAAGGPVMAGEAYTVGERGPELFVPRQSGAIVPIGGGGMSITIQVTQPLGTPDAIARAVGDAFAARMRSLGMRQPIAI